MKALIEELVTVLSGQLDLYGQIRDLLGEERDALVSGRPDTVLDVVRRKETLLLKIRTLDESRQLICLRLAKRWGMPAPSLGIGEVAQHAEAGHAARLEDLRSRLRECLEDIRGLDEKNAAICRNGADMVRQVMDAMAQSVAQENSGGYGRSVRNPRRSCHDAGATMHLRT